ncbi:RNA-binding protein Jag [Alkalibacterium sp. AK22]|uniref:RNA-binding cell elongation regulator Jag/EloR n=1 Tax=Alkalibacterium sp. AK22 TaxID=1229520 RepID=UPI00044C3D2E|nr:RNA-binding cell elongation regulator Jag/EloR [Alkalibacterium sp. AK22]EXJ24291.1 RNA-binding protein Jag [Alkalibacterium sp. AK22]
MRDKYTAQAATTEEAIEKGLKALNINKAEAKITVSQESKKGFLGIGQRDAVVVVERKHAKSPVEELISKEILLGETEGSTIQAETEPEAEEKIPEPAAKAPEKEKAQSPSVKSDKGACETDKPSEQVEAVEPKPEAEQPEVQEKKPFVATEQDEQAIAYVADYLENIAVKMGIEDVSVSVNRTDKRVQYVIDTEDAGLIIGRHGKVLNSLQTLAQIQLHQEADSKFFAKVDAENYRDRRQKTVEQLASRTAEKVKRTKRPVILEPMPAHERKQIHRYLNQHKGVQTHSEGKEPHRYLVVEPSGEETF